MKLFKKQLTLFVRGHSNFEPANHFVVAAWHWNWSITWRWLLWWLPSFGILHPFGKFHFALQKNMRSRCEQENRAGEDHGTSHNSGSLT